MTALNKALGEAWNIPPLQMKDRPGMGHAVPLLLAAKTESEAAPLPETAAVCAYKCLLKKILITLYYSGQR